MAATEVEDGDLIDLGSGLCIAEGASSPLTSEEQEHLLDVCPPKLEQKLSTSQRRELFLGEVDSDDVLVTLGHDKVVPVTRRIDVVSSDTIKRIKNITRNLEPVIDTSRLTSSNGSDEIDAVIGKDIDSEIFETFETQEINNAFNFLADLDDNDEDEAGNMNESISSDGPLMDDESLAYYPLEPVCYVDNEGSNPLFVKSVEERAREADMENCNCDVNERPLIDKSLREDADFENLAFEVSPSSKSNLVRKTRPLSMDYVAGYNAKEFTKINDRRSSLGKCKTFDRDVLLDGKTRRSEIRAEGKSWSEGSNIGFEKAPIDPDEPSTSDGTRSFRRSPGLHVGLADDSSEAHSESTSTSSSSTTSEVDWSWVEEVESSRSKSCVVGEGANDIPPTTTTGTDTTTTSTSTNANNSKKCNVDVERMRSAANQLGDTWEREASVTMSGNATGKSLEPGCPGPPVDLSSTAGSATHNNRHGSNNNGTASWVRASMRRIRHLRLPEAERELTATSSTATSTISAPNSLPDIALIAPEILAAQTNGDVSDLRPSSAPTPRIIGTPTISINSRRPRANNVNGNRSAGRNQASSRQSSVSRATAGSDTSCSSHSSATSSTTSPTSSPTNTPQHSTSARRICERQRDDDERGEDEDEDENPLGRWPHALSPALACLGCTLGLFNISRFAILSIQFGANFIVQFLVLSLVLGIPLLTLQVCLGQRLAAGVVDMWKISPLFQGVGIALLAAQAFIGIYSIVGISWMFVYFRDSFITKQDRYRWAESFFLYRDDTKPLQNATLYKLEQTVPDYFSGAVLQRHHLNEPDAGVVTLKFQVAFNLAVVWMIVFVSLSKGLRSYGKVVYVFTLVPVFGTLVLCAKLLGLTPTGSIHQLFPATVWNEFFINDKSWVAASTEVFLTWGILGAAAMQIAAHNKHKHLLQRDTSLVIVLTFVVLLLAAFLANTCVQILRHHGYVYTTSSFEKISTYTFMRVANQPVPPGYISTPERFMSHASFLAGQRVVRHGADHNTESGYQALRLATELVPATLALLGSEQVSPFWAVLFYFILILFGIAQQLAIWHCVITGIMAINTKTMKLWETTITFFSCACGYILGLPMATELGIYVVYYLDYTVGGAWWIMVLYLVQVGAVFAVRGRPHTGEAVVAELFPPTGRCLRHWAGPLLSFTWNVVLPVALMVLSITIFKSSEFRVLYNYRRSSRDYWSVWSRQLGAAIQLTPILTIPIVAIVQTCRYLNNGPPDIFDNEQVEVDISHCTRCNGVSVSVPYMVQSRIQLLYRPSLEPDDAVNTQTQIATDTATSIHGNGVLPSTTEVALEDPPPKYTPPPSYTTATGARIAKMLRQSFRRSVRRIANVLGESSAPRTRPALQPPPPDYATVLVEMNQSTLSHDITINVTEAGPDVTNVRNNRRSSLERHRPNTIDRTMRISTIDRSIAERDHSTMDRIRRQQNNAGSSNLTAADVANLLRSSIRRGTSRTQQSLHRNFAHDPTAAASFVNLVDAAAPIGQDSMVLPSKDESLLVSEHDGNDDKKTADETENTASVI